MKLQRHPLTFSPSSLTRMSFEDLGLINNNVLKQIRNIHRWSQGWKTGPTPPGPLTRGRGPLTCAPTTPSVSLLIGPGLVDWILIGGGLVDGILIGRGLNNLISDLFRGHRHQWKRSGCCRNLNQRRQSQDTRVRSANHTPGYVQPITRHQGLSGY